MGLGEVAKLRNCHPLSVSQCGQVLPTERFSVFRVKHVTSGRFAQEFWSLACREKVYELCRSLVAKEYSEAFVLDGTTGKKVYETS